MEITLPHNWRPRDYQIPMWRYMEHGGRRSVLLWHRRAGKDDNSLRYLASAAMEKTATYWYLLPKAVQVRRAIWEAVNPHTGKRRVIEAFPDAIVARARDNEMTLTLANGSSVHFLGADNFDTLVGSPPYGIVFSEYSLTNPLSWAYLKPILEENGGWAIFNFTSRGRNHAATLYEYAAGEESWFAQRLPVTETSVFTPEQVEEIRKEMHRTYGEEDGEALFRQEYMCDLDAPVVGAYYGKLLARAADEGRITGVPYDPAAPVFTAWDLGMDDSTAIWVAQCVGREIHLIDYYEANGQPLAHYADWVAGRRTTCRTTPGRVSSARARAGRKCLPGWTSAPCSSSPSRAWPTASMPCAPSCRVAGSTRSNVVPVRKPCAITAKNTTRNGRYSMTARCTTGRATLPTPSGIWP